MNITLHKPNALLAGNIRLPGSKSISNRVLIIKALSGLEFVIKNLSISDDTSHLISALQSINNLFSTIIDIGHAGTDMRFLTAYLALQNGTYELTGTERMQQRPIKDLVEVLQKLGAEISYKNKEGYPPLLISGKQLFGGNVAIKGNVSSQFISALLLIAPYFKNGLDLAIEEEIVSKPYIDMTISIMQEFGANIIWKNNCIHVKPVAYAYYKPEYTVESDWSAASYYYSIVALSPVNTKLTLKGLFKKSLQADAVITNVYNHFGVHTKFDDTKIVISKVAQFENTKLELDFLDCPDIAQTVVCTSIGLRKSFYFTGLQTLKLKETDRISALKIELNKLGVEVDITNSSMSYSGYAKTITMEPPEVSTYNDHRMAMSFAPLAIIYGIITIKDAEVVSKSYPNFWDDLNEIGFEKVNLNF